MIECDAVFEGGGIKGIGLVGAADALEKSGYVFKNVAGSSAGAIVAALIAAGYTCGELKEEILKVNYNKFKGKDFFDYLGFPGKLFSLSLSFGIYNINYIEGWLNDLLSKKNINTFGDLNCSTMSGSKNERYKFGKNKCCLQITATDLNDNNILIFPDDINNFGINPDSFSIAKAARLSCSIPLFYEPSVLFDPEGCKHYIVDGGLISNYPVWILDDGTSTLNRPVFGFKFIDDPQKICMTDTKEKKLKIFDYIKIVISASLDSHTQYAYNIKGDAERTIRIPVIIDDAGKTKKVSSTNFEITRKESEALFQNGFIAGKKFLQAWNFEKWKNEFRPA